MNISAGDGAELALIHAGICDSRMWDAQWQTLGERYRALRFDMRGFGDSPLPEEDFSNSIDLAELMAAAGFGSTVLVGASMGGAVAIDAALASLIGLQVWCWWDPRSPATSGRLRWRRTASWRRLRWMPVIWMPPPR